MVPEVSISRWAAVGTLAAVPVWVVYYGLTSQREMNEGVG